MWGVKMRREDVEKAIADYLRFLRAENRSPETISTYAGVLRRFAVIAPSRLDAVRTEHAQAFLEARWSVGNKSASVALYVKILRAFFTWCVKKGRLKSSPMVDIPTPRVRLLAVEPFSPLQMEAMFAAGAAGKERALVAVFLNTGIRVGELCSLRREDVQAGRLRIMGKGAKERWLGLDERTEGLLRAQMAAGGDPVFGMDRYEAYRLVMRLGKAAAVPNAHPHRFRDTFAVRFLENGGGIDDLQVLLGHASINMTLRYVAYGREQRAIKGQMRFAPRVGLPDGL